MISCPAVLTVAVDTLTPFVPFVPATPFEPTTRPVSITLPSVNAITKLPLVLITAPEMPTPLPVPDPSPPITLIVTTPSATVTAPRPLPAKLSVFAAPTATPSFLTSMLAGTTFVIGAFGGVPSDSVILPVTSSYTDVSDKPSTVVAGSNASDKIS